MKRLPLLLLTTGALVFFALIGCSEPQPAIEVTDITVDAATVTPGVTTTLTAKVKTDGVNKADLTYKWSAVDGEFHGFDGASATWKAPDSAMNAEVRVHVTDGEEFGGGSKTITVGEYTASADTMYVGVSTCSNCHVDTHADWSETAHADAWMTLQNSGHPASYCEPCHSVQQDPTEGNSGYDEVPTAQFKDVQCESCHGPGSVHAESPSSETIPNSTLDALTAETCSVCHEGAHHPYYEDWSNSKHASVNGYPKGRPDCQPCHSGTGFVEGYDANQSGLYAAASDPLNLTCGACHDSHDASNHGQLRTLASITLVKNEGQSDGGEMVVQDHGAGQLCMQCHRARHGAIDDDHDQINYGYGHFGPHAGTQADVVYGQSAYELVNPNYNFASSGHGLIEDACSSCHVHAIEYGEFAPDSAYTGHTFEPVVQACENCHGAISEFTDIIAKKDYDNDGSIEGIQNEVDGLMELLASTLVEYDNNNYSSAYFDGTTASGSDLISVVLDSLSATEGDESAAAVKLRKAGYNLVYTHDDGSKGVHNPAYVVALLQQSILFLDPNAIPGENMLRERQATTFVAMR